MKFLATPLGATTLWDLWGRIPSNFGESGDKIYLVPSNFVTVNF